MLRVRSMALTVVLALFFLCGFRGTSVYGQDSLAGTPSPFGLSAGFGVEAFDEQTFQKLSVVPELAVGRFGIGLDLFVRFSLEGGALTIRREDWIPSEITVQELAGLYLPKFRYIRYGFEGEPLYVYLGSVDGSTMGNGYLVGGYRNTLFLPERRILGLTFELDGSLFDYPLIGFESTVGDLSALDVVAGRLYLRPLVYTGSPVFETMQVGATFAADFDPYRYSDSTVRQAAEIAGVSSPTEARMWAVGGDLRLPLLRSSALSLSVLGDIATLKGLALGGMTGVEGRMFGVLLYGARLRIAGDGFVPAYFDHTYDISRASRYALVASDQSTDGFLGWLGTLGISLFGDALQLALTLDGPFRRVDGNDDNPFNYPHLHGSLVVAEGLIPGFFFDASYDKRLIREFADLTSPEGALTRIKLNFRTGPALVSFFYQVRFEEDRWKRSQTTSGLETYIRLF